mgnify:CR=1 FL=1
MGSEMCIRDRDYIIGEFEKGAGTQFDKSVAETVITLIEEGRIVI